jgi:hypothetical protein
MARSGMSAEQLSAGNELLITYTVFPDVWPKTRTERADVPWHDLCAKIHDAPTYISKRHCPLISLAEYGEQLSDKGILRHAENVLRVYGVEIDYDGEEVTPEEGARRLAGAGLRSIVYTSPSHVDGAPRWRALLPLSEPAAPASRMAYVARTNRALGGIATRESFTLSQSFYIGRVRGAAYRVIEIDGRCVDLAADLEPLYFTGHTDGMSPRDTRTDADLRDAFQHGENRYQSMLKLSSRWAARGMDVDDIMSALDGLFGQGGSVNADGIDLRSRIEPMARSAVQKYGETRRKYDAPPDPRDFMPPGPDCAPPVDACLADPEFGGEATDPDANAADAEARGLSPAAITAELLADIPPRPWLYGRHYCRKMISATASTGGTGKSTIQTVEAISMALGRDLLAPGQPELVTGPLRVWVHNGEDPLDEIRRRFAGALKHHGVHPDELGRRLVITSGRQDRIIMARDVQGTTIAMPEAREAVVSAIREHRADVLILDPFISTHQVNENSNPAIEMVTFEWRAIAEETDCAVDFTHHFRKTNGSTEPSADDIRGASALLGSVRAARVMAPMPKEEAEAARIDPKDRRRYIYEANAKANMHLATDERRWYFLASVTLDNATDPYPADSIGVAEHWQFPSLYSLLTPPMKTQATAALKAANVWDRRHNAGSKGWAGVVVAEALELDLEADGVRRDVGQLIATWIQQGLLRKKAVYDPKQARKIPVVEVVG